MFNKKEPTHVNILGIDIPLATIAYATSTVPAVHAALGEYNVYFSECDADILKSLTSFEALASRRSIPFRTELKRQIFTYDSV